MNNYNNANFGAAPQPDEQFQAHLVEGNPDQILAERMADFLRNTPDGHRIAEHIASLQRLQTAVTNELDDVEIPEDDTDMPVIEEFGWIEGSTDHDSWAKENGINIDFDQIYRERGNHVIQRPYTTDLEASLRDGTYLLPLEHTTHILAIFPFLQSGNSVSVQRTGQRQLEPGWTVEGVRADGSLRVARQQPDGNVMHKNVPADLLLSWNKDRMKSQ